MRNKNYARPKNAGKTFARLMRYMVKRKILIAFVLLLTLASAAAGVIGTYLLKPIVNECIIPLIGKNPVTGADMLPFIKTLLIIAAIYVLGTLATYGQSRIMVSISNGTMNALRNDLFMKMEDLSIRYFDTRTHGEIMSRFTTDVDAVRESVSRGILTIISTCTTVLSTFVMMLVLSPVLTLLTVVSLILMMASVRIFGKRSSAYFRQQQETLAKTNGYIEELIEGQKVIKVFSHEVQAQTGFDTLNADLRHVATQANTFANIIMPVMGNLSYINYALTAAVGAGLIITGRLDLGSVAAFLQYTRSFARPINEASQQVNTLLYGLAGAERIFDMIDTDPETNDGKVTRAWGSENSGRVNECASSDCGKHAYWKIPGGNGTFTYQKIEGNITFEDVSFGYDENVPVLKNITLYAKPNQKIALVGSTGAGKTTITNLINRFYDVNAGHVTYDGIDINDIDKASLRETMAVVLQDTHLFSGSVRDNIRYGRLDATDEEVEKAAKLANADFFIRHLSRGYDTAITADGASLSQGQRQLIAIARAAVANPTVLILDEATSSIDTRTEALIEKGMKKLMENRTVFVIAHRLSTVRHADAIMVIEKGRIIERGDHDDLLKLKGRYYALCTGQSELS